MPSGPGVLPKSTCYTVQMGRGSHITGPALPSALLKVSPERPPPCQENTTPCDRNSPGGPIRTARESQNLPTSHVLFPHSPESTITSTYSQYTKSGGGLPSLGPHLRKSVLPRRAPQGPWRHRARQTAWGLGARGGRRNLGAVAGAFYQGGASTVAVSH